MKLSIIFSFKNEENNIPELLERTLKTCLNCINEGLIGTYEIIFIDDNSDDNSFNLLKEYKKKNSLISIYRTTRSFGGEECVRFALKKSKGDFIVYLDSDLQDPPELIFDMVKKIRASNVDVIYTKRLSRAGESKFKLLITWLGYRFLSFISTYPLLKDVGDFTLLTKRVAKDIIESREMLPYTRGMVQYLSYPSEIVTYHRQARSDGIINTKYPMYKGMVWKKYLDRALLSTTDLPLKIFFPMSLMIFIISLLIFFHVITQYTNDVAPPGWTSLMLVVTLLSSLNFFALGIMSLYINNIYLTTRGRPDIVIREKVI
tara:strand:- start:1164 stop:2114 length:951 start_codon:yes stop_codon:yes gene_type:complete